MNNLSNLESGWYEISASFEANARLNIVQIEKKLETLKEKLADIVDKNFEQLNEFHKEQAKKLSDRLFTSLSSIKSLKTNCEDPHWPQNDSVDEGVARNFNSSEEILEESEKLEKEVNGLLKDIGEGKVKNSLKSSRISKNLNETEKLIREAIKEYYKDLEKIVECSTYFTQMTDPHLDNKGHTLDMKAIQQLRQRNMQCPLRHDITATVRNNAMRGFIEELQQRKTSDYLNDYELAVHPFDSFRCQSDGKTIMTDPVTDDHGHTYERNIFQSYNQAHEGRCPLMHEENDADLDSHKPPISNLALKECIEKWNDLINKLEPLKDQKIEIIKSSFELTLSGLFGISLESDSSVTKRDRFCFSKEIVDIINNLNDNQIQTYFENCIRLQLQSYEKGSIQNEKDAKFIFAEIEKIFFSKIQHLDTNTTRGLLAKKSLEKNFTSAMQKIQIQGLANISQHLAIKLEKSEKKLDQLEKELEEKQKILAEKISKSEENQSEIEKLKNDIDELKKQIEEQKTLIKQNNERNKKVAASTVGIAIVVGIGTVGSFTTKTEPLSHQASSTFEVIKKLVMSGPNKIRIAE